MSRLTRKKDQYPCRIANSCPAEEWIEENTGAYCSDICENCPFEKYINTLAMYEDMMEQAESVLEMMKICMEGVKR